MKIFRGLSRKYNYSKALIISRNILFDKKNQPLEDADMCIELLREMKLPYLIYSQTEKTNIEEAKELSSLLELPKQLPSENVATFSSLLKDININLKDNVFAVGKPEVLEFYKENGYQVHSLYTNSKGPFKSFMITSVKEEEIEGVIQVLKDQVNETKLNPIICLAENNIQFLERT